MSCLGSRHRFAVAAAVLIGSAVTGARAEDFTWTGGGDGTTWNQAANWIGASGGSFPTSGDSAHFPTGTTISGGGADQMMIAAGATVRLTTDSQTVIGDSINNRGGLTFEADNDNTLSGVDTTYKIHGTVDLDGGGQVILNGTETGFRGGGTLINWDNIIRGAGTIDANVVNRNLVRAEDGTLELGGFHNIDNQIGQVEIDSGGSQGRRKSSRG